VSKLKIFYHGVNGIPNVRRLHNIFGSLLLPSGVYTSLGGEALKVMQETHFSGSKITYEGDIFQSTRDLALTDMVRWAIFSSYDYKSQLFYMKTWSSLAL
jgi:hypothetical protein